MKPGFPRLTSLVLDQRGSLHHVRANKEKFDLLATRNVSDAETWAHLAVAGDQLLVRELNALAVYDWTMPRSSASPQASRSSETFQ